MSITINASAILNNLTANNSYAFSSTKRIVKYNSDADETRQSASSLKHKLRSLKMILIHRTDQLHVHRIKSKVL